MPILFDEGRKATPLSNMEYITRADKVTDSDGKKWIETFNMTSTGKSSAKEMYDEFKLINKLYNKNKDYNENKYYHIIINFRKSDNATQEMAMNIGREYIHTIYPGHQAVMSVHCDTDGIHFHACVNSVCMEDGHKETRWLKELAQRKDLVNKIAFEMYNIEPFDWRKARDEKREKIKNDICENDIQYSDEERYFRNRLTNQQATLAYSFKSKLRLAISIAASHTKTRDEFEKYLDLVYGIKLNRNTEKTISFQIEHNGELKAVRGSTLGKNYTAQYIDSILNRNLEKGKKAKYESYVPLFEMLCDIHLEKQYQNLKDVSLYDENGYERTTIELVFILAKTLLEKQRSVSNLQKLSFKDADGNTVYAKTDWRIQNLYDSIVFCRENNIESYSHLNKEYEKTQKEIATLRRREASLKGSIKKMEPIKGLIDEKNSLISEETLSTEKIKPIMAKLHQNNLHDDNDIETFLNRYHSIEAKLNNISQDISTQWSRKRKLEKAIYNFNLAQTEMYCYNLNHTELNHSSIEKPNEKDTGSETNNTLPINAEDVFKTNPIGDDEHISEIDSIIYEANKRHNNQFSKSSKYEENDTIEI